MYTGLTGILYPGYVFIDGYPDGLIVMYNRVCVHHVPRHLETHCILGISDFLFFGWHQH